MVYKDRVLWQKKKKQKKHQLPIGRKVGEKAQNWKYFASLCIYKNIKPKNC